ncbi:hypothetical protein ACM46_00750 [Chryseobacterium angstadtii]|uniref:Secretion system C-terminal sorting domain-containing protein n=1 Tax=Chryseobacterium angstadtii TaxID=558151 RepID=A0A0J7IJ67_9FLAO|nr:T9SS type A sorting domain-containing protein [Chryseobacterium angstadtii]KMQ66127.1 hypothetical protein ACM46_00750 [Chryseobacterium angstadtii]
MKTKLLFLVFLVALLGMQAQVVSFPDAAFKAKLLTSSPGNSIAKNLSGNYFSIDANSDGEIQLNEAAMVGEIEIIDPNTDIAIHDYEGILSFTNLKNLTIDYWNVPANLFTISGLNSLQNLDVKFENYDPGSISLSGCPQLKKVKIYGIVLSTLSNNPLIEDLSISSMSMSSATMNSIESLSHLKNLELLDFVDLISGLSLNLSSHPNLLSLKIINTSLANIDVSGCASLHTITLNPADPLTFNFIPVISINSSNCPNLVNYFVGEDSDISTHIISNNCPGLVHFMSNHGDLSLSLNDCVNLETINVKNLRSLSVTNDVNLNSIKALRFRGTALNLSDSGLQNLKHLEISYIPPFFPSINEHGNLMSLNLQGITSLEELLCSNHQITNLNIAGCINLRTLDCSGNQLSGLDVGAQTNLEELYCRSNLLTSLLLKNGRNEMIDFSGNPDLQYVCCDDAQMATIQALVDDYAYPNCVVSSSCALVLANNDVFKPMNDNSVKIYPIPAKEEVTVEAAFNVHAIELYDGQGKIIQKQVCNSKTVKVRIGSIPSGIYYLKVNTEKGVLMKKMVKN